MPPRDKMCLPHLIRGAFLFKETHMPPRGKTFRLRNNPLMDKCPTQHIIHKTHPVILRSQILLKTSQILCTLVKTNLNMRGPTSYNYPHNPVLGPTGVPLPHQHYPQVNRQLPFLATLDLPDLSRLTNDPIHHSTVWPAIPAKLPSDIPKFDGKSGEDPNNHVMTFHLWCSSNSLMDDSIRLRLFQRTLTGSAAKWYIELPRASFHDFNSLAMSFLTHFQLPIRYETGTELLTSLRQTTSIHISDHIHEWRRRRRLIKAVIPDQLLAEWFTKSLLPQIARDVAMGGVVTEEEAIARAQYLDLVYSQSGTLYELIPNATRATNDPSKPSTASHADGVIGSVKTQSTTQSTGTIQRPASTAAPSPTAPSSTPPHKLKSLM
jgi:hypothetical protein